MTVASALVSGNAPLPQLAEEAVHQALKKTGLTHANGVLLFLTPEFSRHAQQTVTAAARAAQCTQIAGGIASGVFTESGWTVDRPAAAVMVFGGGLSLGHPEENSHPSQPVFSYTCGTFPPEWSEKGTRFGGSFSGNVAYADPVVWQQSRLTEHQRCDVQLLGAQVSIGVSSGLQLIGTPQRIDQSTGFDLERLGGQSAQDSLNQVLQTTHAQQLHQLTAVLIEDDSPYENALAEGRYRAIALISTNNDGSLTLAERVKPGQSLAWAIRQPVAAEADMQQTLNQLANNTPHPACALMFSCIGRGPYFYGGEDRDLNALCKRFPNMPLLGTYGTGQIAPRVSDQHANRQLQNAVVTALISKHAKVSHV